MSIIQSIRDRGAWILFGVIALALVAFILQDGLSRRGSLFGNTNTVAKINGVKIDKADFDKKIEIINQLLEKSISDKYYSVLFNNTGYKYVLDVQSSKMNSLIYIGVKKSLVDNENNVIEWLNNSIICEETKLDIFIRNRVLGFSRRKMDKVPNLVPSRGVIIFEIALENFTAENFKLCIFNDNKNIIKPEDIYFYQKK